MKNGQYRPNRIGDTGQRKGQIKQIKRSAEFNEPIKINTYTHIYTHTHTTTHKCFHNVEKQETQGGKLTAKKFTNKMISNAWQHTPNTMDLIEHVSMYQLYGGETGNPCAYMLHIQSI